MDEDWRMCSGICPGGGICDDALFFHFLRELRHLLDVSAVVGHGAVQFNLSRALFRPLKPDIG